MRYATQASLGPHPIARTSLRLPRRLLAAAVVLLGCATASAAQLPTAPPGITNSDALRAFVCGSASPLGPDPTRAQACIAVIAGERIFLVDTGPASAGRLGQARLPMQHLEAVLLTHFHSDHIGALGEVNNNSWIAGRDQPLAVMGGSGVEAVVAGFNQAYAADHGYREAHHGKELLPAELAVMNARTIEPGRIYEQGGLVITAFAVEHEPIQPALGYRFDYLGRSVVVSGDTVRTDSLIQAAKGADLLFHDTMLQPMVRQVQGMLRAANPRTATLVGDVLDYHATKEDVLAIQEAAGVRLSVLYHLVPNPMNPAILRGYQQGLPETAVIAEDGMLFVLPAEGTSIERSSLF